jgi:hypothetical protein
MFFIVAKMRQWKPNNQQALPALGAFRRPPLRSGLLQAPRAGSVRLCSHTCPGLNAHCSPLLAPQHNDHSDYYTRFSPEWNCKKAAQSECRQCTADDTADLRTERSSFGFGKETIGSQGVKEVVNTSSNKSSAGDNQPLSPILYLPLKFHRARRGLRNNEPPAAWQSGHAPTVTLRTLPASPETAKFSGVPVRRAGFMTWVFANRRTPSFFQEDFPSAIKFLQAGEDEKAEFHGITFQRHRTGV